MNKLQEVAYSLPFSQSSGDAPPILAFPNGVAIGLSLNK